MKEDGGLAEARLREGGWVWGVRAGGGGQRGRHSVVVLIKNFQFSK